MPEIPTAAIDFSQRDIAEFVKGLSNPPPASAPTPTPPAPEPIKAVTTEETSAAALAEQIADAKPQTPQEKYLEGLKKLDISRDEAAKIVDSMLFSGSWTEDVIITSKLKVQFRTRGQLAVDRLNVALEKLSPQFTGSLWSTVAEYNLCHSLVSYGVHKFDASTDEGFDQVQKYIKKLPGPVFQLLASKLAKFDERLTAVMADGVEANF